MKAFKIITLVTFVLLCGLSFASCDINKTKIDFSQITYSLKEDSTADITLIFGVNYEKECLLREFVNVDVNSNNNNNISVGSIDIVSDEVPCPIKFQELILSSFSGLSSGINCYGTHFADKNYLQMSFYGTTTKLSDSIDKNFIFKLEQNDVFTRLGRNSTLTIILPQNASILQVSPKQTTFMTPTIISWSPVPKENIIINYTPFDYQKETFDRLIPVLVIVSILFLFITLICIYFMRSIIISSEKIDYAEHLASIKDKMRLLEASYLRRQIDETTYRRLNEQYQLQLNELNSQIVKEKKKTGFIDVLNKFNNKKEQDNTGSSQQKPIEENKD